MQETQVQSLGQADALEKVMTTHSSILAWEIPWKEESVRLQSIGSGRSAGEGIDYSPCPWASLVAQLVRNLAAMRETWVQSLGWQDPLEKGKGYPLQHSGLEKSVDCVAHGVTKSQTLLSDFHFHFNCFKGAGV